MEYGSNARSTMNISFKMFSLVWIEIYFITIQFQKTTCSERRPSELYCEVYKSNRQQGVLAVRHDELQWDMVDR